MLQGPSKRRSAEQSNYAYLVVPYQNWTSIFVIKYSLLKKMEFFLVWVSFIKRIHLKWKDNMFRFNYLNHIVEWFAFQALRRKAEEIKPRLTQLTVVTLYLAVWSQKLPNDIENLNSYLKTFLAGTFLLAAGCTNNCLLAWTSKRVFL